MPTRGGAMAYNGGGGLAKFPQEISRYALTRVLYDVAQRQPPTRPPHCPTSAAMLDNGWRYG